MCPAYHLILYSNHDRVAYALPCARPTLDHCPSSIDHSSISLALQVGRLRLNPAVEPLRILSLGLKMGRGGGNQLAMLSLIPPEFQKNGKVVKKRRVEPAVPP